MKDQLEKTSKQTNEQTTSTATTAPTKTETSTKKKTTTAATKKVIPFQANLFFRRIFRKQFTCFCLLSFIHLRYRMMFFIMSHFFVKANVFTELVKVISFSLLFTFRIYAMRLFKFMNFLSLDLNTYNLNISSM